MAIVEIVMQHTGLCHPCFGTGLQQPSPSDSLLDYTDPNCDVCAGTGWVWEFTYMLKQLEEAVR